MQWTIRPRRLGFPTENDERQPGDAPGTGVSGCRNALFTGSGTVTTGFTNDAPATRYTLETQSCHSAGMGTDDARVLCDGLLPLAGHRIGITADRRAEEQGELLSRMGAEVSFGPVMRTLPLGDDTPLRAATEALLADPPTMVLLLTGIGMRAWIGAAESWGLAEDLLAMLSAAPVYARGPKAHAAAVQAGVPVWKREPTERLDKMIESLTARPLTGAHLALQLYGNDVPWAVKALVAAGARVTTVPVYRWVAPDDEGPARRLIREAVDGHLSAVTFTCPAAARSACRIADSEGVLDDLLAAFEDRVAVACVGPVTLEAAQDLGIHVSCSPDVGRLGLLVRALSTTLQRQHLHLRTARGDVVLQGSVVTTATGQTDLSDRERQVLMVLARRPGVVVARSAIERDVWGSADEDGALDAVLTRLRRTLAPAGLAITTRVRRGFQLEAEAAVCPVAATAA
jgi:uroporphyrinogen-III synthase